MLNVDELAKEIYDTFRVAVGGMGKGEASTWEQLDEPARKMLEIQARTLLDRYYLFRRTTADNILTIMQEEIDHWKGVK
jgi:hypothetical protein